MTLNLTSEQQAAVAAIAAGDPCSVRAVAGSGKTSGVLVPACSALAEARPFADITCVAFNKSIADTLSARMPSSVDCRTMNSLGHRAWQRVIDTRLRIDTSKTYKIIRELRGDDYKLTDELSDIPRLVALMKQAGVTPEGFDHQGIVTSISDEYELNIPDTHLMEATKLAFDILDASIKQAHNGVVDFNDQLYMPICFGGRFEPKDFILCDEAQDLSPIQHEMLRRLNGVCSSVGDPHQAIYAFRGASHDSMDLMADLFNQTKLPLTYTFRCSAAVTAEAQTIVPHIRCPDSAAEGSVRSLNAWSASDLAIDGAILCRNTKPLVSLAYKLIRERVPCHIMGRDIGKGLIKLIDTMRGTSVDDLILKLENYERKQCAALVARHKEAQADALRDRIDSILVLADDCDSILELKELINKIFDDTPGARRLTLATIHKAKGLEWPTVYFLDRHLLPSKYAKSEGALQQEDNLLYVGITRALRDLVYINSKGMK